MNIAEYNRNAWNQQSLEGCRWSTPWPDEWIERAAAGEWSVILTPNRPAPDSWFPAYPDLSGVRLLAPASGGGQQTPLLASRRWSRFSRDEATRADESGSDNSAAWS